MSTCLELFPGVPRYRISWLMALPEMGADRKFDTFVHLRENIQINMIFASFSFYHNVGPGKSNIVGFSFVYPSGHAYICGDKIEKNNIILQEHPTSKRCFRYCKYVK